MKPATVFTTCCRKRVSSNDASAKNACAASAGMNARKPTIRNGGAEVGRGLQAEHTQNGERHDGQGQDPGERARVASE